MAGLGDCAAVRLKARPRRENGRHVSETLRFYPARVECDRRIDRA